MNYNDFKIYIASFLVFTFSLRLAIPYGNFILLPFLLISIGITFKQLVFIDLKQKVFNIIRYTYPILLLLGLLLLHYIFTNEKHEILSIELLHSLSGFLIFSILILLIRNETELDKIYRVFIKSVVYSSIIVAFFGVTKLYFQIKGFKFPFLDIAGYPKGTTLVLDNNYYSLFIIFGIIIILSRLRYKQTISRNLLAQLALFLLTISILFSESRRGILVIFLLIAVIYGLCIFSLISNNRSLKNIRNNTFVYGILVLLLFILFYAIIKTPTLQRNRWLAYSKVNKNEFQSFFNLFAYSYNTILNPETNYEITNEEIWGTQFDSRYPFSGWAKGNYIPVDKIVGSKAEIVPDNAIGAKIDKLAGYSVWNGNLYYHSKIFNEKIRNDKRYVISIYCYVSGNFNGDWVRLGTNGKVQGKSAAYYDLNKKGEWQKLITSITTPDSGSFVTRLFISKSECIEPNDIEGYVIYAYPQIKEVEFNSNDPYTGWANRNFEPIIKLTGENVEILPDNAVGAKIDKDVGFSSWGGNLYYHSKIFDKKRLENKRYIISIYCYVSSDFNGDWVRISSHGGVQGLNLAYYDLTNKGRWQYLITSIESDTGSFFTRFYVTKLNSTKPDDFKGYVIFAYPQLNEVKFNPKDPLTWAGRKFKYVNTDFGKNVKIVPKGSLGYLIDKESNFSKNRSTGNYYSSTILEETNILKNKIYLHSVYCYVSEDFNGIKVRLGTQGSKFNGYRSSYYNMHRKGEWQKLQLRNSGDSGYIEAVLYFEIPNNKQVEQLDGKVIFAYPQLNIIDDSSKNILSTKYINKASLSYTSLFLLNKNLKYNKNNLDKHDEFTLTMGYNDFVGPRIDRWRYAWYLYRNEYNFYKKIFGGGFNYTKKFASTFSVSENYEYPHNPFLSVLLYSGVIGIILYLWVLIIIFKICLIYFMKFFELTLCFFITFLFCFFSSNNPFDPAILSLFMFFPFLFILIKKSN